MSNNAEEITQDVLGDGALEILQHKRGYRFGLDALLLATDLPELPAAPTVVELGAAQGIVSLCVARQFPDARVLAVERQDALFGLLERNIALNELEDRVEASHVDLRDFRDALTPHSADLVVCNPPYFRKGERRPSSHPERAAARHELHGGLSDFVAAAGYVLEQRGRLKLILPPIRLPDLFAAIEPTDFAFESMRFFHSRADTSAYLVESVLRRGGAPDIDVRAPLYIYRDAKDYTDEVEQRIARAPRPPSESASNATS